MNKKGIHFFTEGITYHLKGKRNLRRGIKKLISEKNLQTGNINIIFCSDRLLKRYNKEYLKHDYFTDVIAFDLSEDPLEISGDIFASIERIRENAGRFRVRVQEEIARIVCHGVLHLMGMEDSTSELRDQMRKVENRFISALYNN